MFLCPNDLHVLSTSRQQTHAHKHAHSVSFVRRQVKCQNKTFAQFPPSRCGVHRRTHRRDAQPTGFSRASWCSKHTKLPVEFECEENAQHPGDPGDLLDSKIRKVRKFCCLCFLRMTSALRKRTLLLLCSRVLEPGFSALTLDPAQQTK